MTLFVDMDEVLADTYGAHIELYNKEFNAQLKMKECLGKEAWQCVPKAHQQSIKDHVWQTGFFKNLKVIPDSQEVLSELSKRYEVYIASAAMQFPNSLVEKSDWLDEFFPFIPWQKRILCGDKHILKGNVLIDDRSYNLKSFNGKTIMFTSPHNINIVGFDRANSWKEIADKLL